MQRGTTVILYLDKPESYNEDDEVVVPDIYGKTMKDVAVILSNLGLRMEAEGTGIAKSSRPEPGTTAKRGTVVEVRFEPVPFNR